jgi:hypothetical protein
MLTVLDKYKTKGKWVTFCWKRNSDSGKTQIWEIVSDDRMLLGYVEWHGRWRKYAFFPLSVTLYEEVCLREIAEFIETLTKQHREAAKAAKAGK